MSETWMRDEDGHEIDRARIEPHPMRPGDRSAAQSRVGWAMGVAVVGAALPVAVLTGDPSLGLLFGFEILFVLFVRRLFARTEASFAAGFLPSGAEIPLPRGLQEDDDVRWNWEPIPLTAFDAPTQ